MRIPKISKNDSNFENPRNFLKHDVYVSVVFFLHPKKRVDEIPFKLRKFPSCFCRHLDKRGAEAAVAVLGVVAGTS